MVKSCLDCKYQKKTFEEEPCKQCKELSMNIKSFHFCLTNGYLWTPIPIKIKLNKKNIKKK